MKISTKLVYQYMAIFFNFSPTSSHLHPLQVENCDSNSRLVVDEDDNGKRRLERVNIHILYSVWRQRCRFIVWYQIIRLFRLHFTLRSLGLFSCAISTSRRAYSPAAILAHWTHRKHCHLCPAVTHLHLGQVKHAMVKCLAHEHEPRNNVPMLRGKKHDIFILKHAPGFVLTHTTGRDNAKYHAPAIAPLSSQLCCIHLCFQW